MNDNTFSFGIEWNILKNGDSDVELGLVDLEEEEESFVHVDQSSKDRGCKNYIRNFY